jgi:hypothetical protein
MISYSLETITPQEAERMLREHDEAVTRAEITNRPRSEIDVRKYTGDMQADRWNPETGETLKFETHDKVLRGKNLVDGQNRLEACHRSGRSKKNGAFIMPDARPEIGDG